MIWYFERTTTVRIYSHLKKDLNLHLLSQYCGPSIQRPIKRNGTESQLLCALAVVMDGAGVSQEATRVKQEPEWGHDKKDLLGLPCDVVLTGNIKVEIKSQDKEIASPDCLEDTKCNVKKEIETQIFVVKMECDKEEIETLVCVDESMCDSAVSNQQSGTTREPTLEYTRSGRQLESKPHEELSNIRPTAHQQATDTDTQDTDDEDYNCDTCGRNFPQKRDLIHHIQKAVTECFPIENKISSDRHQPAGNKAFWCDICEKQFRDSSDISRHRRIHTGEKPFECEVCKKQFAQSSVLSRHRRIHTDQKPYSCNMCEKHFRASCDLTKHKRIHVGQKPVTCEICQKQLMGSDALTKHRRIHTGGKPHSCVTCGKQFARTSDLVIHTRIHTGEKPYACDICKRQFARSYKLKEHARVHTTPKPGWHKTHAT